MFVKKGKFAAIEHSKWSFEGLTCVFFLAAVMTYLIDAKNPQNLIGVLLLVFTLTYMVFATIFVTSTERCNNQCQRACTCETNLTPKPKTGWLMLAVLTVRYVTLAGLLAASML